MATTKGEKVISFAARLGRTEEQAAADTTSFTVEIGGEIVRQLQTDADRCLRDPQSQLAAILGSYFGMNVDLLPGQREEKHA